MLPMWRSLRCWLIRQWLPAAFKVRGVRMAYMRYLGALASDPAADQDALVRAATQLGVAIAADLRAELELGDSVADADAAWGLGCQVLGLTHQRSVEGERVTYDHTGCDWHQFNARRGACHCETLCLPMVRSLTATLAPSVTVTVDRAPSLERGCRKSLS